MRCTESLIVVLEDKCTALCALILLDVDGEHEGLREDQLWLQHLHEISFISHLFNLQIQAFTLILCFLFLSYLFIYLFKHNTGNV